MAKRNIVVIGASAGGVFALKQLVGALPVDFPASLFIVMHVSPHSPSVLPAILSSVGPLPATHPTDGERMQPGHIYIAPPDHHLLIEYEQIIVKRGPKENRFRPSIDALFRSAAYTYEDRVVGVVLTGMLDDGTSGMWSIKRLNGVTIVQEPDDAAYASMPNSVLDFVEVDYNVPLSDMSALLTRLVTETIPEPQRNDFQEQNLMEAEIGIAAQENAFDRGILSMGELTTLTCPECSGALISIKEGKLVRYRCHTGHAYTANSLLAETTKSVEESFWKAIRSLEETVILLEQSGKQLAEGGNQQASEQFFARAREARERARFAHSFATVQERLSFPEVTNGTN